MEHTSQNGDPKLFYPGGVNVSFAYVESESLLMALKEPSARPRRRTAECHLVIRDSTAVPSA